MKIKIWYIIVAVLTVLFGLCAFQFYVLHPLKYKQEIQNYSKIYNINPGLVAAIICAESRFKATAVSISGASGLMQIMPSTFDWIEQNLGQEDANIFDPETNIKYGCYYLNYLFNKYPNSV